MKCLADPGEARGCSINSLVIHSFIHSVSKWAFSSTALQRRHAQTVRGSTSSYKIDYVIVIRTFLNPERHQNRKTGSKVTVILLKGWILPIGGASAVEGLWSTGLPLLVFIHLPVSIQFPTSLLIVQPHSAKNPQQVIPCYIYHSSTQKIEKCHTVYR